MILNPIEEIKEIRHQLGADVDYDISRVFDQLRDQQNHSDRTYLPVKEPSSYIDMEATKVE